jgi:hypothetical protein
LEGRASHVCEAWAYPTSTVPLLTVETWRRGKEGGKEDRACNRQLQLAKGKQTIFPHDVSEYLCESRAPKPGRETHDIFERRDRQVRTISRRGGIYRSKKEETDLEKRKSREGYRRQDERR